MPKTIQIRDVDDQVYATLAQRAARKGISVPELLRREVTRYASKPTMEEWLERVASRPRTSIATPEINDALDELRGPWPENGG